ncbi:MAG TPA: DUF2721 domain-containing protein [Chitinophagales bacterium]|nr:DUF2721 domain-containing protein [Chitinophagales bacterium]HMZ88579.1 DUF2721 domain-containing protein [Chitinophagales bacterium]HNA58825.1 DUF2721 domain-containing protein [Chitinophagales bacterium]HNE46549.1 DUF2721 domain-containing protein [Chitinophagales bacterium]HNF68127.1 DUF2721 domain-containing protein [Chitinophagales bacterium]
MDITINTPALLFPAISLVMLAYTNRFMALSSVVRKLHDEYEANRSNKNLPLQIRNLQFRIKLVRRMQFFGVTSFIVALISMYLIYVDNLQMAHITFATAMLLFACSLVISLIEIMKSTNALELELSDMEDEEGKSFVDYIKKHI